MHIFECLRLTYILGNKVCPPKRSLSARVAWEAVPLKATFCEKERKTWSAQIKKQVMFSSN